MEISLKNEARGSLGKEHFKTQAGSKQDTKTQPGKMRTEDIQEKDGCRNFATE